MDVKTDKTLGYQYFLDSDHPLSYNNSKVWYHRHVMSEKLGRLVRSNEVVHHKDGDRTNNDPDNLEVMTASEHGSLHAPEPKVVECGECGEITRNKKFCSQKCNHRAKEKINWPTYKELTRMVEDTNFSAVGRELGVSDNAVRKRLKNHTDEAELDTAVVS